MKKSKPDFYILWHRGVFIRASLDLSFLTGLKALYSKEGEYLIEEIYCSDDSGSLGLMETLNSMKANNILFRKEVHSL